MMCGVTVMGRIRNEVIREEVGAMRDLAGRAENSGADCDTWD